MYTDVQDVTAECSDASPARIKSAILLAEKYIERMTGQWFELRSTTMKFDGRGSKLLQLPVFAFDISEITIDDSALSADDFTLYNRFMPDDRENPKIIFASKMSGGNLNVEITGRFGYVESDESTPLLIQKVCNKLAIVEANLLSDEDRNDVIARGRVIEEETDEHMYKLSALTASGTFTGDSEIDQVLVTYRKPLGVASV